MEVAAVYLFRLCFLAVTKLQSALNGLCISFPRFAAEQPLKTFYNFVQINKYYIFLTLVILIK